jgi:hypothetical protein
MWRHADLVWNDVSEERFASIFSLLPPSHAGFSTLKMEAICYSETSFYTRSERRYIPDDGILHSRRCENLKSYTYFLLSFFFFSCSVKRRCISIWVWFADLLDPEIVNNSLNWGRSALWEGNRRSDQPALYLACWTGVINNHSGPLSQGTVNELTLDRKSVV